MTPKEINKLAQQSNMLKRSLKMRNVYTFLRKEEIAIYCSNNACEKCNVIHASLLISPYNGPHPGWCVECVLHDFFAGEELYSKYRDPRSKDYDAVYDNNCNVWDNFSDVPDDYDGPPIAWS
jgi:hypothetical protein